MPKCVGGGGNNSGLHHPSSRKPGGNHKGKSRALSIRRAESFHHSRSLGDFDKLTREDSSPNFFGSRSLFQYNQQTEDQIFRNHRGKSVERMIEPEKPRKLQKSKSMEFLKAKLLSRKSSTKSQVQPQHNHGPLDPRLFQGHHQQAQYQQQPQSSPNVPKYDWRQDTPFWNSGSKGNRPKPQVPANKPNLREEPWTHLHSPASLWPAGQHAYPPGLFFGAKKASPNPSNSSNNYGYPSFNVANPKNPSNVSRNIVLPPQVAAVASAVAAAGNRTQYHHHQVAFAAAAAAAAAQAAAQAAAAAKHNKQSSPVMSESLKDRLEITELSDAEENNSITMGNNSSSQPLIPSPDYVPRRASLAGDANERRASSANSHHGKILDIPSGLY